MEKILKGAPVAAAIDKRSQKAIRNLREEGVRPMLAVVRIGKKPDDVAYENSIARHADKIGLRVLFTEIDPQAADTADVITTIKSLNADEDIHGILLFKPLPDGFDEDAVVAAVAPEKDVDGATLSSAAGVFLNKPIGYPPCTAAACLAMMTYYDIDVEGKNVCVVGRSPVIGRPVAMMLVAHHATVTICHTRTRDIAAEVSCADIVVAAAGHIGTVTEDMVRPGQILIDVGINFDETGKMVGDITAPACKKAEVYTPVPGGVGAVTTAILCNHVVRAAEDMLKRI